MRLAVGYALAGELGMQIYKRSGLWLYGAVRVTGYDQMQVFLPNSPASQPRSSPKRKFALKAAPNPMTPSLPRIAEESRRYENVGAPCAARNLDARPNHLQPRIGVGPGDEVAKGDTRDIPNIREAVLTLGNAGVFSSWQIIRQGKG